MLACSGQDIEVRKGLNLNKTQQKRPRPLTSHSTTSIKKAFQNKQQKSYVELQTVLDSEYDYTIAVQKDQKRHETEKNLLQSAKHFHKNSIKQLEEMREKNNSDVLSALSHLK